jgi:hypothetical protein
MTRARTAAARPASAIVRLATLHESSCPDRPAKTPEHGERPGQRGPRARPLATAARDGANVKGAICYL